MQNLKERINAHPRATLLIAGTSIFAVATIAILVMFISLRNSVVEPTITPAETKQVLSEVIKNNPKDLINNNTAPSNTSNPIPTTNQIPTTPTQPAAGSPAPVTPQPEVPVAPNLNDYNYRVTTVTYAKGPSYDVCGATGSIGAGGYGYRGPSADSINMVTEYYEYFERYLTATKRIVKEDNNLSDFSINKYGNTINNSTYYLNGDFAVQDSYKPYTDYDNQQSSQNVSYPMGNPVDLVKNYFGTNAAITDIQTAADGTKYYIIQSTFASYCDPSYDPYLVSSDVAPAQRNIIIVYKVNANTFAIEQVKKYIDVVSDLNLLDISNTTVSRSKVSAAQIDSQFKLASNITLVKHDYSNLNYNFDYSKDYQDKIEYLSANGVSVLLPVTNDGMSYLNAYGYKSPESVNTFYFFNDRTFFPSTTWGDKLYARYNQQNTNTTIDYTMSLTDGPSRYYTVTAYKAGTTVDDIISESLNAKATSHNVADVTLTISNVPVPAKKITRVLSYVYPSSYGVSYPASYGSNFNTQFYTTYVVLFSGKVYTVNYYNYQQQVDFDQKQFIMYPLDTAEVTATVKQKVVLMYNIYNQYWYPTSYPVSFPTSFPSAPF